MDQLAHLMSENVCHIWAVVFSRVVYRTGAILYGEMVSQLP